MKPLFCLVLAVLPAMAARPPVVDTLIPIPAASTQVMTRIAGGGWVGAYYLYENSASAAEVRQFSRGGEKVWSLKLDVGQEHIAKTAFSLPNGSYVVAGNMPGDRRGACAGSWVALFKDRQQLWLRKYCSDTAGFSMDIQKGAAYGADGMFFVGLGARTRSAASMAFMALDADGTVKNTATTWLPQAVHFEISPHLPLDLKGWVIPGQVSRLEDSGSSVKAVLAFGPDHGLQYQHVLGKDMRLESLAFRRNPDGTVALLGERPVNGNTLNWYRVLDPSGNILDDTSFALPHGDTAVCIPDDSLGLPMVYRSENKVTLLKVDRQGRVIYHVKYADRWAVDGSYTYHPPALGPGLVFWHRVFSSPSLLSFDESGVGCGDPVSLRTTRNKPSPRTHATRQGPTLLRQGRCYTLSGRVSTEP